MPVKGLRQRPPVFEISAKHLVFAADCPKQSSKLPQGLSSENPSSKSAGLARENIEENPTLMLSANSSSAFAPVVSMEVISPGSLFLVPAAVPWNSSITDQRKKTKIIWTFVQYLPSMIPHPSISFSIPHVPGEYLQHHQHVKSHILLPARKGRCCDPNGDQDLLPLMLPLTQYLIQEVGASQSPAGSRWNGALLNLDAICDTWRTLWHRPSRLSSE